MKFPFVSRKKYDNERGRIIAYFPVETPKSQTPPNTYCYHGQRVGWTEYKEFKTYKDFLNYNKKDVETPEERKKRLSDHWEDL